jgi:hypothetical protein
VDPNWGVKTVVTLFKLLSVADVKIHRKICGTFLLPSEKCRAHDLEWEYNCKCVAPTLVYTPKITEALNVSTIFCVF